MKIVMKIETNDFSIEPLGIQEIDVYDIEVEDNHNFFGNNILVHNSLFVTVQKIVEKFFPNLSGEETFNLVKKITNEKTMPAINGACDSISEEYGWYLKTLVFKLEAIASSGFLCLHPDSMIEINGQKISIENHFLTQNGNQYEIEKGIYAKDTSEYCSSFSLETQDIIKDVASLVARKKYRGKMIKIETDSGKILQVTPCHKILVRGISGLYDTWKMAKDLNLEDDVCEI